MFFPQSGLQLETEPDPIVTRRSQVWALALLGLILVVLSGVVATTPGSTFTLPEKVTAVCLAVIGLMTACLAAVRLY